MASGGTGIGQWWHRDWPEVAKRLASGGTGIGQMWHRDWPEVAQGLARGGTEVAQGLARGGTGGTGIGQRWHRDWPEVAQVSDFIWDIGPRMCFFVLFVSVMRLNIFSEQLIKTMCGNYCNALCSFTVNTSAS